MKLWPRKMMKCSQSLGTVNLSINFFVLIPPLLTKLALYIVHVIVCSSVVPCPWNQSVMLSMQRLFRYKTGTCHKLC